MPESGKANARVKGLGIAATSAVLMAALGTQPAHAQQAGDPAVSDADAGSSAPLEDSAAGGLNEIVVTADKREENLQRVALSVTALDAGGLETRNITQPDQLAGLAPGVQIQSSFILLTYTRGVGNYSAQPGVDQSVAYNVDGNYLSRPYAMPNLLFDLERVEFLRGPQGTLQGRNSTGGSLNLVTARPTTDFNARVALSYGNYDAVTTEGIVNVPIGPDAALRLAAASSDHDGYAENGFFDANRIAARARLLVTPTSRLEVLLTAEFSKRDEKGPTYSPCPPGSVSPLCVGVEWRPFSGLEGQGTDPDGNILEPNFERNENSAVYGEINYDLDFATLTWAPSYRFVDHHGVFTIHSTLGLNSAARDHMHNQELRLASNPGSPFTWVAGLYYGRQRSEEQFYFLQDAGPSITIDRPGFDAVGHVFYFNDVERYVYTSKSIFGQVSVPLFDGFRVVAGGRYTWDRKSTEGQTGLVVAPDTAVSTPTAATQSAGKFTYKVGFEYDVAPDVLLYANTSTGFKSGGVNGVPPSSGLPATFAPETNTAYQAGFKSRFLDDKLQINAEAFYYDYRGYVVSSFGFAPPGILVALNLNSQKARMYGGEIEAAALVTENDRLDLAVSVLDAKFVKFDIPAFGLNLDGRPMQNSPHFTFTGNYSHTFELGDSGRVIAHGEARYESEQWTHYLLPAASLVDGYWRLAADVTYHSPDDRWSIGAFIRNITNDGTPLTIQSDLAPFEVGVTPVPRTYGLRVAANF